MTPRRAAPVHPKGHVPLLRTRQGFRMNEWCGEGEGVASPEVVALCHKAYG